jgi:hypothetical protein
MSIVPFWKPEQYSKITPRFCHRLFPGFDSQQTDDGILRFLHGYPVPVVGMLCGNAISGVTVSVSYVLQQLEYVVPLVCFLQVW